MLVLELQESHFKRTPSQLFYYNASESLNFILYNVFDSEFRRNIFALFHLKKKDGTPEILMGELNVEQTGVVSVGS